MPPKRKKSSAAASRTRTLNFLLDNVGRVLDNDEIREASGNVSEWARRLRELRDEYGYQILSHKDRRDLSRPISASNRQKTACAPAWYLEETRAWVLERNGYTCQMCGVAAGDSDHFIPGTENRLNDGYIIDQSERRLPTSPKTFGQSVRIATKVSRIPRRQSPGASNSSNRSAALQSTIKCIC